MWNLMLLLRTKRWNVWCNRWNRQQQHVIPMTICELGPGLWFGQLHPGEELLTAISAAECSHSPHRIIHQPRKTLGRENMLPPKICMTDSSKVWLQFIGALWIKELHLHFWRGRLHIHIKRRSEELEIVLVFDSPEQSFSSSLPVSSLPVSSLPWLPRKW